jgi:hypothetical protein
MDVGVIMYCTEPAVELPGLFNTWLISEPLPALAPVMPPLMAPIDQLKKLAVLAVKEIFGLVPVQIADVAGLVTAGVGFTVTVIVNGEPAQLPVDEVGVTTY